MTVAKYYDMIYDKGFELFALAPSLLEKTNPYNYFYNVSNSISYIPAITITVASKLVQNLHQFTLTTLSDFLNAWNLFCAHCLEALSIV